MFHNAHVLTLIFQAKSNENNFKIGQRQPLGADGHVQQGHGGGHHVGGRKINISQCTCFNPNFSSQIQ